jgi:hypothetical protein
MADPFGGPFAPWDKEKAYNVGERVSYGGYIYELMDGPSTNDNPRTATYSATFTPTALGGSSTTLTMRRWLLWDYPAGYYMAIQRGLPPFSLIDLLGNVPVSNEVRLVQVRAKAKVNEPDPYNDTYDLPDKASYEGYRMPAGMDSKWLDPEDYDFIDYSVDPPVPYSVTGGKLMYAPATAAYADGYPAAYEIFDGQSQGVCFSPTCIIPLTTSGLDDDGNEVYNVNPIMQTETQGQMIASYGTFSREFKFLVAGSPRFETEETTTTGFQDDYLASPSTISAAPFDTIDTNPEYKTT